MPTTHRSWVGASEFHAVADQNIARSIRDGEYLSLSVITASDLEQHAGANELVESIGALLLESVRESDTVGRLEDAELGLILPSTRRLQAFDVLAEIGRVADREAMLPSRVHVHVGIAELDPGYRPPTVLALLNAARRDLQIPGVRWPELFRSEAS